MDFTANFLDIDCTYTNPVMMVSAVLGALLVALVSWKAVRANFPVLVRGALAIVAPPVVGFAATWAFMRFAILLPMVLERTASWSTSIGCIGSSPRWISPPAILLYTWALASSGALFAARKDASRAH